MKNKIIKLTIAILAIVGLTGLVSIPVFADNDKSTCTNICECDNVDDGIKAASGCENAATSNTINNVIINILNGVLGLLAAVAVLVIVIGGVQYMTSAGDPGKTKKAKDTILYATIGLIIAALAAVIVNFVINLVNSNNDPNSTTDTSTSKTI